MVVLNLLEGYWLMGGDAGPGGVGTIYVYDHAHRSSFIQGDLNLKHLEAQEWFCPIA